MWREAYEDSNETDISKQYVAAIDKQDMGSMSGKLELEENYNQSDGRDHSYFIYDSIMARLMEQAELARTQNDHFIPKYAAGRGLIELRKSP
ncbi:hypothetical protein ElyMa_005761300 [Elysia marginata]|uniref:Uncharacterized protein n=1 Tax=Elysia marginata TaxID=1093978 RepID=A0AAV4FN51_9GAST|nr:hypothetical protein ElyMa_005761300 [Elysia marginata]